MNYNYIHGLSGGADSCYVLLVLTQMWGIAPKEILSVTFDNGWDTDIAKHNCKAITEYCGVNRRIISCDLYEYKEIQRAHLLSLTPHAEGMTDLAIKRVLLNALDEYNAKRIVTGTNKKEGNPSEDWSLVDGLYVRDIMKRFGRIRMRTFPGMNLWQHYRFKRLEWPVLDYIDYNPDEAKETLKRIGWKDYGIKHHENAFTKFNQAYRYYKFNIDMRTTEEGAKERYDLNKPPVSESEYKELLTQIGNEFDIASCQLNGSNDWRQFKSYRKWINRIKKLINLEIFYKRG